MKNKAFPTAPHPKGYTDALTDMELIRASLLSESMR